jgi:hypothetical protein
VSVEDAPIAYREELTAVFFAIFEMNDNIAKIRRLLEEEDDGEAAEDD